MERFLACPEINPTCNDTSSTSALLALFPLAVLLASVFAWPLARFVPRQRVIGGALAFVGAAAYLVYSSGLLALPAWVVGVVGLALLMGRRGRAT